MPPAKKLPRGPQTPASSTNEAGLPPGAPPPPTGRLFDLYTAMFANAGPARPPAPAFGTQGMPPFPPASVTFYTRPCPPRVPAYLEKEDALKWCANWYRSAVESRLGKCHPIRLAGETRKYFEDALGIFVEHEIRPGAWVAWMLDGLLLKLPPHARKRFVPKVSTLLSPRMLSDFRWAYRNMELDYAVQAWMPTDEGQRLSDGMWEIARRVRAGEDFSQEAIDAVVLGVFPEGYRAAYTSAREKSKALGQETISRLHMFHWLWPIPKRKT